MSISNYFEERLLKALKNETSAVEKIYVKLHTGDPGETGTANAAGETKRKQVTFGAIANPLLSNNAQEWTNVSTSETYKYISLWDNESAGNCLWSGPLEVEKAVTAGDGFVLASGKISVSLD